MVRLKFVRKSVRRILIGRDEDGPSEDRPKVRLKDMIGQDEDGLYEDRPKLRPKDMIGRDKDGLSEDCPKSVRRI